MVEEHKQEGVDKKGEEVVDSDAAVDVSVNKPSDPYIKPTDDNSPTRHALYHMEAKLDSLANLLQFIRMTLSYEIGGYAKKFEHAPGFVGHNALASLIKLNYFLRGFLFEVFYDLAG